MTKNKKSKQVDNESELSDFDLFDDKQSECDKLAKPSSTTTKIKAKESSKPKAADQSSPKVIASTSTKSTISITKISKPITYDGLT